MRNKKILIAITAILIAGFLVILSLALISKQENGSVSSQYDSFAKCLKEKGAVFYGAFWCPHCQNQKKIFGKSAKFLPYVECSTPDGRGQISLCQQKKIDGYPTWEFADGSRELGEVSLAKLSEKTGCPLP